MFLYVRFLFCIEFTFSHSVSGGNVWLNVELDSGSTSKCTKGVDEPEYRIAAPTISPACAKILNYNFYL